MASTGRGGEIQASMDAPAPLQMRAWRSNGPGIAGLALERCAAPIPGPRDALIAVRAAAVNFFDLLTIDDKYQTRPRPFTIGGEVAGRVLRAGGETALRPGQLVASKLNWGGFAEYALV